MHLDRPAIIDVHAIIDNDSGFVQVPLDAIAALRPDGLVLLEAPPEVVSERRRSDHRTRPARADLQIDRELLAERERVAQFSEDLRVPLETAQVIPSFRLEETIAALRQRIRVAAPC
jgi:adenylate kinase